MKQEDKIFIPFLTAVVCSIVIYVHQLYHFEQAKSSLWIGAILTHGIGVVFTGFLCVIGVIGVYFLLNILSAILYKVLTGDKFEEAGYDLFKAHPLILFVGTILICWKLYEWFGGLLYGTI